MPAALNESKRQQFQIRSIAAEVKCTQSPKTKEAKRTWHFRMFECCAVTPSFRGPGAREEHGVGAPSDEQAPE